MENFPGQVATTQWVLTEVADAFAGVPGRRAIRDKFRVLDEDGGTEILLASPELFDRGLWLYDARPDKGWSLTDRVSFVVMADEVLTDTLMGDRHFEQVGFRALLAG